MGLHIFWPRRGFCTCAPFFTSLRSPSFLSPRVRRRERPLASNQAIKKPPKGKPVFTPASVHQHFRCIATASAPAQAKLIIYRTALRGTFLESRDKPNTIMPYNLSTRSGGSGVEGVHTKETRRREGSQGTRCEGERRREGSHTYQHQKIGQREKSKTENFGKQKVRLGYVLVLSASK